MHYSEKVYRPPHEANTVLLQVTVGCSHNRCRFCNSYKDISFKVETLDQIEEDLKEVQRFAPDTDRIFLLNADAFVLSYEKLKTLAVKIHEYLPKVKTISSMARVTNMKNKTVEQLVDLKICGYNDLYIGTESGLDDALKFCEKGHLSSDSLQQLKKLDAAGFDYTCFYMLGLAGSGNSEQNAIESAAMFNQLHPKRIGLTSLTLFPDAPLYQNLKDGTFTEVSELERTKEFQTFLKNLETDTYVESIHVTNGVPLVGNIPEDKAQMFHALQEIIDNFDEEQQHSRRKNLRSV